MKLNWKKVKPDLPAIEVLAVNGKEDFIVGHLYERQNGSFTCESEDQLLEDVTHYITVKELSRTVPKT